MKVCLVLLLHPLLWGRGAVGKRSMRGDSNWVLTMACTFQLLILSLHFIRNAEILSMQKMSLGKWCPRM
uniref:Uncharacterized protein n=1 Tax=Rhizophora mucronata TaxID=61149 RepID=A0A2P2PB86_RHIMU